MKRTIYYYFMAMVLLLSTAAGYAKKVHTLGDSTMAPYDESATVTRGWGMYFGQFLTNGWTSVNYAKGGRDSRGGYNELWQTAKNNVEAGDYVIISFGHNDEKNGGMDGVALYNYYVGIGDETAAAAVDQRGTVPSTTYKEYLGLIVDEAKAKGAIPVICSPVCRSYFSGSTIRRNGRHDLGDSYSLLTANGPTTGNSLPADDHTMDYAYQSQQVAIEKNVAFVDLTTATKDLYESYDTEAKCQEQLFDGEGATHFNTTGALLVARECARLMKEQNILADNITLPTDLSVSPATGDFGAAYKGQTISKEFTINGFGLSPEEGTVSISATDGIQISFDKSNWQQSLSVDYTSATLIKIFYAQLTLTQNGQTTGTITVTQGNNSIDIPVTATAVVLEGGTDMNVYWRLESNDNYTLTGPATVIGESWTGMYVKNYSNPNANTVWPAGTDFEASRKMQRNLITGDNWPADEIDDNPNRYIQFGVKPNAGNDLKINNISFYMCGAGGSGMCAHVYYSTDNFATRTTIFEGKSMTANNPVLVHAEPVLTVKDGEELLVRIYPWYNGAASGKTLCISDVTIGGMAFEAEPEEPEVPAEPQELAKWTFDTGYDVTGGVYTPNNNDWTELSTQWFKDGQPTILPNETVGNAADYTLTGKTARYWSITTGYNNQVFRIVNDTEANAITDLTDPSQHNNYYEVRFPTTGYKDIQMNLACSYGGNANATLNAVVSVDGGQTWSVAENYTTASGWWLYNEGTLNIQAQNKEEVIVRLIFGNDFTSNWNLDYLTLIGTPATTFAEMYALTTTVAPASAGSITVSPSAAEYEAGTQLTLTATANLGYDFAAWKDANGNVLSTANPYTMTINANTEVVATFNEAALPEGTPVVLADWNIEQGYDVTENVYTPNGGEWADGTATWFNQAPAPTIRPDSQMGSADDYALTAWSLNRYWQLREGYQNHVLRIENEVANNITNFTDGSQHNVYYEIQFPTKGYKNVTVDFACAYGTNAEASLEAVVSTDNGQTWVDAGTYTTMPNWWLYKDNTITLSANNKDKVILRLIAGNDFASNWNLNYIKVNAEVMAVAQPVNKQNVTVAWPFHDADNNSHTATVSAEDVASSTDFELGEKLYFNGTQTVGGIVMSKINPNAKANAHDDSAYVKFTVKPKKGITFLPKKLTFDATKCGTSGGNFDIYAVCGEQSKTIVTSYNPSTSNGLDQKEYDIEGMTASEEAFEIWMYIWNLNDNKQVGLANVTITGDFEGMPAETATYTLNTSLDTEGAGTITCSPAGGTYDEGTEVTVAVKRNLGYLFKGWSDGTDIISTASQIKVTMDADKTLIATFETTPVYTVTTKVTNDADRSLGSITLSPNDNNGKYEAGTEITATANESKILKFMQWTDNNENASATATRTLTVNGDMELVANYEVQDFVAVFDASKVNYYAYDNTANYPFPADLAWDEQRDAKAAVARVSNGAVCFTQNGGTPVVRNREGSVMTGLNGLYQNGYRTTDVAFQYQFSTKGFTAARFDGAMAAKNMASKNWKALVSTDGTTFTAIDGATWTMTANVIKPITFDLPATAIDQDMVYIRIMGDGDEVLSNSYPFNKTFDGLDYCDHSESGVGNVYILGTAEVEEDSEAPVVTSTIPANNATGVSASGRITISYDERIQAAETNVKATLNGEEMTPQWSSRSVSFDYFNLTYGQTYTFLMPTGFVEDKSGNQGAAVELTFTVMDRQQPTARTFNAIVDHSLAVDKIDATADMPAQYRKIQDAIDDAPSTNTKPYLIYIKEGYYDDPNETFNGGYGFVYTYPDDPNSTETTQISGGKSQYDDCKLVYVNKPNIHIIGQAVDKVTIATDRLDGGTNAARHRPWYHVNAGAALEIQPGAEGFYMENITIDNENWTKLGMEGPQALSINTDADRIVFNNMNVRSYQDTYKANGTYKRAYWHNSTIEGSVDFIYGDCDIWFENTTLNINRKNGGYIVAPSHPTETRWGYVFNNTRITSTYFTPEEGKIYMGRPWHNNPKTVFLHTQMEVGAYEGYWYETMGGLPALWAVYDIWDKNGNKMSEYSIEDYWYWNADKTAKITGKAKNSLTAEEVAQYTIQNVLAGDGSNNAETGVWNPLPLVEKTEAPVLNTFNNTVTWSAVDYAICYVVTVNGKAVAFPTETCISGLQEGDVVTVQSVNENGGLSEMSQAITVSSTVTTVTTTAIGWTTVCLAYDAVVPEGTKAYYISAKDDESVTLTPITQIPAGEGFIFNAEAGDYEFAAATTQTAAINNLLVGTATETAVAANSIYVLDKINDTTVGMRLYSGTTIAAGKAYLPKTGNDSRSLRLVIADDATGIVSIENGKLNIENGAGAWYDLQGRQVAKPQKGLYIVGGKKVILK